MPKVHILTHFADIIAEFGQIPQFSTPTVELPHQGLNLTYSQSNKVNATDETLRYAGYKDAIAVMVANFSAILRNPSTVDKKILSNLRKGLSWLPTRKARLATARENRARMQPKKIDSNEK
ncbi:hypothetical protein M422DRAFT_252114 [Sphaerobolus stellatus SS14]|uniref:Uncharacterized protein n=1 Tax=Sphaerobolus stellatus (strain SS14) TaxID=990650 RepID=A0A0C9VQD6_SPHS4|nr:hypothetical protein M422DRAFT_252114 [Sphaerobolus stellatus SS14]